MSETVQKKQEGTTMEERFGKCPYATVQSLLSGKWAMLILHYLDEGTDAVQCAAACHAEDYPRNALRAAEVPGGERPCKETEDDSVPQKVEYSLTKIGKKFTPPLRRSSAGVRTTSPTSKSRKTRSPEQVAAGKVMISIKKKDAEFPHPSFHSAFRCPVRKLLRPHQIRVWMTPFRQWFGVMAQGMQPHWRRSPAPRIPQGCDGKRAVSYMLPRPERILQGPLMEDQETPYP